MTAAGDGQKVDGGGQALADYLELIDAERDRRPAEAMLHDEIMALRDVLVFADGLAVHLSGDPLARLYQTDSDAYAVMMRAGCWPKGCGPFCDHRACDKHLVEIAAARPPAARGSES